MMVEFFSAEIEFNVCQKEEETRIELDVWSFNYAWRPVNNSTDIGIYVCVCHFLT